MRALCVAMILAVSPAFAEAADQKLRAEQIWAKAVSAYDALPSYADTGTMVSEYGASGAQITETHTFMTALSRPRRFYFEFDEDPEAGADRFVIWCDAGDFNSWWSATGVHEVYRQGQGALAFALGSHPTRGAAALIPAMIFAQAGLKGALHSIEDLRLDSVEKLGDRDHYKLSGIARERYSNDYVSGERPMHVWIDAETFMIAKIVQDTPINSGEGVVDRITTVLKPVPNAEHNADVFRFAVPKVRP